MKPSYSLPVSAAHHTGLILTLLKGWEAAELHLFHIPKANMWYMPFQIPHMLQVKLKRQLHAEGKQERRARMEGWDLWDWISAHSEKATSLLEDLTWEHANLMQVINPEEQSHSLPIPSTASTTAGVGKKRNCPQKAQCILKGKWGKSYREKVVVLYGYCRRRLDWEGWIVKPDP